MSETTVLGGAEAIKEINSAREKLNEDPYLGKVSEIVEAFKYNLCEKLVLNDPNYEDILKQMRLAEEEAEAEAIRLKEEAEAEARRIAEENGYLANLRKELGDFSDLKTASNLEKDTYGFSKMSLVGIKGEEGTLFTVIILQNNEYKLLEYGDHIETSNAVFVLYGTKNSTVSFINISDKKRYVLTIIGAEKSVTDE